MNKSINLEDTVVKAKEVMDITGQKVSEFVSVQKIRLNIVKVRAQIESDYKLLGKLYYSGVKRDNVDATAIQAIVDEIDLETEKLRELRVELAFAKGNTVCDSCGAVNLGESEFCCKCGKAID